MLFSFVAVSAMATEQDIELVYWKKLLHYGETQSRIINKSFFLSDAGHRDYRQELSATLQYLKQKNGQQTACQFPARYQWIKYRFAGIPEYDLQKCATLQQFVHGFQKQNVSVSFASEYMDKPVSSFGHTMLVFHDHDKPLLSADAIHFAAKTAPEDGVLAYTKKGLSGGYEGYFFRDPFFKKQYQYNILEQRYIHLYTLKITDKQIENLIYHLYELRNAQYRYYFIKENCAFQIAKLIDIATNENHFTEDNFVLPVEVIKSYRHFFKKETVLYPNSVLVKHNLRQMTEKELDQFEGVLNGDIYPDETLSNRVIYTLSVYYEYAFRNNKTHHPNYDAVTKLKYTTPSSNIKTVKPLQKPAASRMAVGFFNDRKNTGVLLSYRPMLYGLHETQQNAQQSELVLFNPVFKITSETSHLEQLNFISIKSFPTRSTYFKPVSWQFYTGLNRNNPNGELNFETEFGFGLSNRLNFLSLHYGINIGLDFTEEKAYYKPNVDLNIFSGENIKIGLQASEKIYSDTKYIERSAFISLAVGNHGLLAKYTSLAPEDKRRLDVSYHYYF